MPSSPPSVYTHSQSHTQPRAGSAGVDARIGTPSQLASTSAGFGMAGRNETISADTAAKRSLATEGLLSLMRQAEARAV